MASDVKVLPSDPIDRLFDLAHDLLGTASPDGFLTCVNPAWEQTLGWTKEQLLGKPLTDFIHRDDVEKATRSTALLLGPDACEAVTTEDRLLSSDGTYRTIEWTVTFDRNLWYFIGRDVTDRKLAEGERDRAASLTKAIVESVADGIVVADASGRLTYGNPAAVRLLGYAPAEDLRGPNFHDTHHHSHLDASPFSADDCPISKVRYFGRPVHVHEDTFWRKDGSALPVSYSSAPIDLVNGTGSVVAFRDISTEHAERERVRAEFGDVAWFEEVRQALANRRFVLYGQPIVTTATREIIQHELLLRMLSPLGEVISAGIFLPAAEKYGLMDEIDRWVITQSMEIAASGQHVAINLSAGSVGRDAILQHIEQELTRTATNPENLLFEVTETAVMNDLQDGRRFAERLVALGCAFALDDFGTGYGSFTYLRQLPITHLKIDVQFVREMTQNLADQRLVETIVSIAKGFGKKTIAEGVEDEETLHMLSDFGVDFAQGYYLGRPEQLTATALGRPAR